MNKPSNWAIELAKDIEEEHLTTRFSGNPYTGEGVDVPCFYSIEQVAKLIEEAANKVFVEHLSKTQ